MSLFKVAPKIQIKKKRSRHLKHRRTLWDFIRPRKSGVITGAADNDPSGIVTYTQTGAVAGLGLLWTVLFSLPMLVVVEEMSTRVGIVTKRGLNKIISAKFGFASAVFTALIVAVCNTLTIGANLAFMSQIASIFSGIPAQYWVGLFGLILLFILLKKGYAIISRYLLFITPIFLLYIISAFMVPDIPWANVVVNTVVPRLNLSDFSVIMLALGVFGTTVSPYLIFWQTTEEIEEKKKVKDIDEESAGVVSGMFFTQTVFFFIVLVAALVLHGQVGEVETAEQAALALKPLAGNISFFIFSIGIMASGLLAVPVLTASTAYTVADTFNWKEGLDKKQIHASGFYTIIILAMIAGIGIALSGFSPVMMLVYSQVLNGVLVPILLVYLILIANDKKIMGQHRNSFLANLISWVTVLVMGSLTLLMIWSWFK